MGLFGATVKAGTTATVKAGGKASLKAGGKAIKSALPDSLQYGLGFGFKKSKTAAVDTAKLTTKRVTTSSGGISKAANFFGETPRALGRTGTLRSSEKSTSKVAKLLGESESNFGKVMIFDKVGSVSTKNTATGVTKVTEDTTVNTIKTTGIDLAEDTTTATTKSSSNLLRNGAIFLGATGTALGAYVLLNDKQKGKQIGSKLNYTTSGTQNTAQKDNTLNNTDKQTKTYIIIGIILLSIMMLFYLV